MPALAPVMTTTVSFKVFHRASLVSDGVVRSRLDAVSRRRYTLSAMCSRGVDPAPAGVAEQRARIAVASAVASRLRVAPIEHDHGQLRRRLCQIVQQRSEGRRSGSRPSGIVERMSSGRVAGPSMYRRSRSDVAGAYRDGQREVHQGASNGSRRTSAGRSRPPRRRRSSCHHGESPVVPRSRGFARRGTSRSTIRSGANNALGHVERWTEGERRYRPGIDEIRRARR